MLRTLLPVNWGVRPSQKMRFPAITLVMLAVPLQAAMVQPPAECEAAYSAVADKNYESSLAQLDICAANLSLHVLDRSRYLHAKAWALYSQGRANEAIAEQEKAFTLASPSYRLEFINYATMLRSAGRFEQSLGAVKKAEQIDRSEGKGPAMMTRYHKGWTLQEMGRHREAIEAFSAGIPDQPDFPFVYWKRSSSYAATANRAAARADMRRFASLYTAAWRKHSSTQQVVEYRNLVLSYGLTPSW